MRTWQRHLIVGSSIFVAGALALVLADPYIPHKVAFDIPDPAARQHLERIIAAHGYAYRYDTNVRGDTLVVIDRITSRQFRSISCEHGAWDAKRQRALGVTVLEDEQCAP